MVYNTPFILAMEGATDPIGCGIMAFVANSIAISANTGVPALASLPIESYADGTSIILSQNGSSNLYMYKEDVGTTPGVLSNNYLHMGNMYTKYRVLNVKTRVSGMVLHASSANTDPSYAGCHIWNSFATDDKEVIDSLSERDNFCRPFIRMNRNTRTHTFLNQYTHPSTFVHKFSPMKLIKDRTAITSGAYDGTCDRAVNIGTDFPTYSIPNQEVYNALNVGMYGFHSARSGAYSFPRNMRIFSGYLTSTKTVKFFEPHANQDFYDAV